MSRLALFLFVVISSSLCAQDQTVSGNFGSITFTNVKQYRHSVSYSSSVTGASGFLALRALQPINNAFLNQYFGSASGNTTIPGKGSGVGFAKVFQTAAPTIFNVREVVENTTYYWAMVPYRIAGATATFVVDSSVLAQVTSSAANTGTYYNGINFNSADVLSQLTLLINPHTLIDYTAYKNTVVQVIFERDTMGQHVVNCEYSGEVKIYPGTFDFVALNYSREHMLAQSWMPTGTSTATAPGADYHNLALTNLSSANVLRSNYPLGEVVTATDSFLQCKKGKNAGQETVFEPMEEKKGDAARAMFYEMLCYNGMSGSWGINHLLSFGTDQEINVLLNWHFNDPPDAFEKARHEYVASLQGNRNPFIDFPALANCIDFSELVKSGSCGSVGVEDKDELKAVKIFPSPASDFIHIKSEIETGEIFFSLYELNGRMVIQEIISRDNISAPIRINHLSKGLYLAKISTGDDSLVWRKVVIE